MLLHIIFDKNTVSEKNRNILKEMYEEYRKCEEKFPFSSVILPIVKNICDSSIEESNKIIEEYKRKILNNHIVKKCIIKKLIFNIFQSLSHILLKFERKITKRSIAITRKRISHL